jgi:hypothetical protein
MNEAGTRTEHIDPALAKAGWGVVEGSPSGARFRSPSAGWKGRARGFIAGQRRGAAGQGVSSGDAPGKVGAAGTVVFSLRCCLPSMCTQACTQSKREVMETA